jgi:hypothetical protein
MKQYNVRMNEEELEVAGRVASHYGLSIQSLIWMLIKREEDRLALDDMLSSAMGRKKKKVSVKR